MGGAGDRADVVFDGAASGARADAGVTRGTRWFGLWRTRADIEDQCTRRLSTKHWYRLRPHDRRIC
ncbi:MAG: hypothetical protein JSS83_28760 [Cyanobacteria bacterium SZAS LIN-3]|nr:hypothetical protein [Cyanobacteria bacterium SZAS LIN-3]